MPLTVHLLHTVPRMQTGCSACFFVESSLESTARGRKMPLYQMYAQATCF